MIIISLTLLCCFHFIFCLSVHFFFPVLGAPFRIISRMQRERVELAWSEDMFCLLYAQHSLPMQVWGASIFRPYRTNKITIANVLNMIIRGYYDEWGFIMCLCFCALMRLNSNNRTFNNQLQHKRKKKLLGVLPSSPVAFDVLSFQSMRVGRLRREKAEVGSLSFCC